ncbi:hypothetical protein [Polyangium sp. 6x1]|uniref:hypothetical protein n=1 Tax=Polyangium sp. 6x1 TaxID=3042689 RepID=UPI00248274CA|nr:hypothetical protein [Polyangium sp. 6x1]MDI1451507.1 hypothetical protein [Polyangium sp. 6x1]
MRISHVLAAASSLVMLGGCMIVYKSDAYDDPAGAGGASSSSSVMMGPGGAGGVGGAGGAGGVGGGGDICHPALCDADSASPCTPNAGCPPLAWSDRWGATDQQRVRAVASDGTRIALAGEYNGISFNIGRTSPRTLPLNSPDFGYEAFVTLLDGDGVATWASPVAIGLGLQPRTASAVAFAGGDIVVAGARASDAVDSDVFIHKFTPGDNNAIIEVATIQFGGDSPDTAVAIAGASTGEFYVAGTITASTLDTKFVTCGGTNHMPVNGMFVAGYTATGGCKWFLQLPGKVQPTALVYDQKNALRVVGHFEGTLTLADNMVLKTAAGATDSFIAQLAPISGAVTTSTHIKAETDGAVRVAAAALDSDGTVYVAGQLEGGSSIEPNLPHGETAAFVMADRLENPWKRVFTGGKMQTLESVAGTSLAISEDGSLYLGGTFRNVIDIDPASPSGTFERSGVNPFLARFAVVSRELSWFDVYDGGGQMAFTRSFYVTTLQNDVVLAGNWLSNFNFSEDKTQSLPFKGNASDEDIIAAKITPKP